MKCKLKGILLLITLLFVIFLSIVPQSLGDDTVISYQLKNLSNGTFYSTLNVVVPEFLIKYYNSLSHASASVADFSKFITPYAVEPIANCLRTIYSNDEDFTNAVLSLVSQIPYETVTPAYYPVETLIRNSGDCDLFSYLAASILIAGGLDVVLLYYPIEEHMNIGVNLDIAPQNARISVSYVKHNNDTLYYVAEVSSPGWRVGESPDNLESVTLSIVSPIIEEKIAPGQVSASFSQLNSTSISLKSQFFLTIEGSVIKIAGYLSPSVPNQKITIFYSQNESPFQILDCTTTQIDGSFSYSWIPVDMGFLNILVTWSGNSTNAGTTSNTIHLIILPYYLIGIIIITIILLAIFVYILIKTIEKKRKRQSLLSQIPPSPDSSPFYP